MRVWLWVGAGIGLATFAAAGCTNPLVRQYEYEEQLYLDVDGSAELVIDSSIAALVALRNLPLDASPAQAVDRERVRALFDDPACGDVTVNRPWTRHGRRFVQIVLEQDDVQRFAGCGPVSWSTFAFERVGTPEGDEVRYRQAVGPPASGDPGQVNWTGGELVGFKLHLPSRILYHNVRRLEDGEPGDPARGNILTWEQTLADRRAGRPVEMEVRMHGQSILNRALWLFAGAFAAAVTLLMTIIWIVIRRARAKGRAGQRPDTPRNLK
jgi:hypothetical protein